AGRQGGVPRMGPGAAAPLAPGPVRAAVSRRRVDHPEPGPLRHLPARARGGGGVRTGAGRGPHRVGGAPGADGGRLRARERGPHLVPGRAELPGGAPPLPPSVPRPPEGAGAHRPGHLRRARCTLPGPSHGEGCARLTRPLAPPAGHGARVMPVQHHLTTTELQKRISSAATELAGAEKALLTVLEALPMTLRSEKQIISATLTEALEKVAAAKGKLEGALAEQPDGGDSAHAGRDPPR